MIRVQFYQAKDEKWYWRLVAKNGKIIADGAEGYATRGNAVRAIERTRKLMQSALIASP